LDTKEIFLISDWFSTKNWEIEGCWS